MGEPNQSGRLRCSTHRHRRHGRFLMLALAMATAAGTVAHATDIPKTSLAQAQAMEQDCLDQLMAPTGDVACAFPTVMDEPFRAKLAKLTQDEFKDAQCMITVKLERSLVDAVTAARDGKISVPAQKVACRLEAKSGALPVDFSFAPSVTFKDGKATAAHPGMGDVKGVSSWLAWPVVTFINSNTELRGIMLRVVNAYIERRRGI